MSRALWWSSGGGSYERCDTTHGSRVGWKTRVSFFETFTFGTASPTVVLGGCAAPFERSNHVGSERTVLESVTRDGGDQYRGTRFTKERTPQDPTVDLCLEV